MIHKSEISRVTKKLIIDSQKGHIKNDQIIYQQKNLWLTILTESYINGEDSIIAFGKNIGKKMLKKDIDDIIEELYTSEELEKSSIEILKTDKDYLSKILDFFEKND